MVNVNTICKRVRNVGLSGVAVAVAGTIAWSYSSFKVGQERQKTLPEYSQIREIKERARECRSRIEQLTFKEFKENPQFFYQTRKDLDSAVSNELSYACANGDVVKKYEAELIGLSEADKKVFGFFSIPFKVGVGLALLGVGGAYLTRKEEKD